jgi:hypothetical protein
MIGDTFTQLTASEVEAFLILRVDAVSTTRKTH